LWEKEKREKKRVEKGRIEMEKENGSDEMTLASVLCAGRRVHPSDGVRLCSSA